MSVFFTQFQCLIWGENISQSKIFWGKLNRNMDFQNIHTINRGGENKIYLDILGRHLKIWQKTKRGIRIKKRWVKARWESKSENGLLMPSFHQSRNKNWEQLVFFFDSPRQRLRISHIWLLTKEKKSHRAKESALGEAPINCYHCLPQGLPGVIWWQLYLPYSKQRKHAGCWMWKFCKENSLFLFSVNANGYTMDDKHPKILGLSHWGEKSFL